MYLVLYLNQRSYEFNPSLHATLAEAEAAFADALREFVFGEGCRPSVMAGEVKAIDAMTGLPPRSQWDYLFDNGTGEQPHIYRIECDGKLAELISINGEKSKAA